MRHGILHEKDGRRFELTVAQIEQIKAISLSGHAPVHISQPLNINGETTVHSDRVYYQWKKSVRSLFERHRDPRLSMLNLVSTCANPAAMFTAMNPFALGAAAKFSSEIIRRHGCGEVFIDSTYRTNSEKLKIFCVFTSFAGSGFPLVYLFLKPGTETLSRKRAISGFFTSLREFLSQLRPMFFFTDKDVGQMEGIENIFGLTPILCVWHMKRAIKKLKDALRKVHPNVVSDEKEQ